MKQTDDNPVMGSSDNSELIPLHVTVVTEQVITNSGGGCTQIPC